MVIDQEIFHIENHRGVTTFRNCHFINNVALTSSRFIKISHSESVFDSCYFVNNLSTYRGGCIGLFGGHSSIKQSIFDQNTALLGNGAAINTDSFSVVEVLNSSFKMNNAANGGAIFHFGKKLSVKSSSFKYNTVNNDSGFGGAIFSCPLFGRASNTTTLLIETSSFFKNSACDGGSLYMYSNFRSSVSNCSFRGNSAAKRGGAISQMGMELKIRTSLFHNNGARSGGAIDARSGHPPSYIGKVEISNCSFKRNEAKRGYGGAMNIEFVSRLMINTSSFDNNSANDGGGAIYFLGEQAFILSSWFHNNRGTSRYGSRGGAILFDSEHTLDGMLPFTSISASALKITNCTFHRNSANYRGGTVMATRLQFLTITMSKFLSSSYSHERQLGAEFLYSEAAVIMSYVVFEEVDNRNFQNPLIIHHGQSWILGRLKIKYINFGDGVHIKCLPGRDIQLYSSDILNPQNFSDVRLSCNACSKNLYSLSGSSLYSQNGSVEITNRKCHQCPLGGVCEKGKIRAASNSWGYVSGSKVFFTPCPFGYCCAKGKCKTYFSCHEGRNGTLCGQCRAGLSESLVTPDCFPPKDCQKPWFSMVVSVAGIAYVLVFMYMNELVKAVKALLVPSAIVEFTNNNIRSWFQVSRTSKHILQFIQSKFKKALGQTNQLHYFTNDVWVDQTEEMCDNAELVSEEEIQVEIGRHRISCNDNTVTLLPGLLKIFIFFYQTNVIFKVYAKSKSPGSVHVAQEVISVIFNLRIDGTFVQDISWCPIDNLQPVSKALLKTSFIVYIFLLIIFIFILMRMGRQLKIIGAKSYESNKSRLLCCSLRLILISYGSITAACLSLLSCVQLGPFGNVLFIDGTIECYRHWQVGIMFVVGFWICPLPIAIHTSSQLLCDNKLSPSGFLLCVLFPVPSILYWLYTLICCCKKASAALNKIETNKISKEVLEIMEGPFRSSSDNKTEKKRRLSWESILITRRLILIFIKTFVFNTFVSFSLMLLGTVLFLIHHIYVNPYSSGVLNKIDTLCLLMLAIICFLNLVPAYQYAYPSDSYINIQGLIQTQQQIETILRLVFPFIIGSCIAALVLMRIFQLLFWLCRCLFRFVICIKQKLS